MASNTPTSTVYAQNLEERVKLEPLVEALKCVFSEFGGVVDIVANKNVKARGQAFILFDNKDEAENAIGELHGFNLFGKPLKLCMARTRSDKTIEMKCTGNELAEHKRHRQEEKDKRRAVETVQAERNLKRGAQGGSDSRHVKLARPSGSKSGAAFTVIPDEFLPPNKVLFLQNVPDEYDIEGLTAIFGRYDGFREIRLVPGRLGIAFVEYETEQGAIIAKNKTAGMMLKDMVLQVTYQRQ